jgi:hypothetical protein
MISSVTAAGSTIGNSTWLFGASVGIAAGSSVVIGGASVSIISVSTGSGAAVSTAGGGAHAPKRKVINSSTDNQTNIMRFILQFSFMI